MACESTSDGPILLHSRLHLHRNHNQKTLSNIKTIMLIQYPHGYPITTYYGQAHRFRLYHPLFRRSHALHCDTRAPKLLWKQKGEAVQAAQVPCIGLSPDRLHRSHQKTRDQKDRCRAPIQATGMTKVETQAWRDHHQLISTVRHTRDGLSFDQALPLYQSVQCRVQQLICHSLQHHALTRQHPYRGLHSLSYHLPQMLGPARQNSIY